MLKERLKADRFSAMKDKTDEGKLKKGVLTNVFSSITTAEKESGKELTDVETIAILQKELKQTKEALAIAETSGRQDRIDYESQKIDLIESYLPQMLTADEIRALLAENGVGSGTNMGEAMKIIKPLVAGKADNALVAKTVKEVISQ